MCIKLYKMKHIKQIPYFNSNQVFELSASEMETILTVLNKLPKQIYFMEHLISRFIDLGQIEIAYQDQYGNPASQEDLINFLKSSLDSISEDQIEPEI